MMDIRVRTRIMKANDDIAAKNREHLNRHGVFLLNVMASPGAGKTTFILALHKALGSRVRMGVIEGDVSSSVDAERVARAGIPVHQINTDGGCHLDARHLEMALPHLPLSRLDLVVVENVGNLICTAGYDLGEHTRVVICSVPEGDDKPYKYPRMFHVVDAVVISKIDLAQHVEYSQRRFADAVSSIRQDLKMFPVNGLTGEGMEAFASWLVALRN